MVDYNRKVFKIIFINYVILGIYYQNLALNIVYTNQIYKLSNLKTLVYNQYLIHNNRNFLIQNNDLVFGILKITYDYFYIQAFNS